MEADSPTGGQKRKSPEDTDGDALSPRKQPSNDVNAAFQGLIDGSDVSDVTANDVDVQTEVMPCLPY